MANDEIEKAKAELSGLEIAKVMIDADETATLRRKHELLAELDLLRENENKIRVRRVAHQTSMNDARRKIERLEEEERQRIQNASGEAWKKELVKEVLRMVEDYPNFTKARDYQYDDIMATIEAYKKNLSGMLNANDMGAGKTMETVICLYIITKMMEEELGRTPRILWLTKKSLVRATPNEIRRWWPGVKILTPPEIGTVSQREFHLEMYEMIGGIFMANYEFARTTPKSQEMNWDIVVIDEVHKLKGGANASGPTVVWETCKNIASKARFSMMLTGTPMVNKPEEMWSYLHIFDPARFPDMKKFRKDFCEYKEVAGQFQITVDPIKILNNALQGQMIRRSRAEFGIELPDLDLQVVELEMYGVQKELYDMMRSRFFVWLDSQSDHALTATAVIAQLTRLRQINLWPAGIGIEMVPTDSTGAAIVVGNELMTEKKYLECKDAIKIDEAMDRIEMVTSLPGSNDDSITEQIVIFCTFNEPMREIQRRCDALNITCEVVSGQQSAREKGRDLEKEFQNGKIQVLCINSAMGEGLNLQKNPSEWIGGASYGILMDKWWSPLRQEQCIGRIHRQGDTKQVTMWVFENANSVDSYINAINEDKTASFASIMDSKVIRPATDWKNYLGDLI